MTIMKKHPILFLHGALGSAQDMKPLMDLIKAEGHEVYSFDFSGHGKSAVWPNEFRIDLFARDLETYLKKQKLTSISIFGHSMGGYVALYHKVNYEDSPITHIFTYGTKFNWGPETVSKELPNLNPEQLLARFPEHAKLLASKHGERWKILMRSTAHMIQNLEKLDGLTKEDMGDIQIPVILMLGDQDRMVTSEETNTTKAWLHHVNLKTISHSKHDLERANLKEITQVMLEALD